jgi:SlyX protein
LRFGRRESTNAARQRALFKENAMTEDRLMDIEIKLSRQEDLVDTLNAVVYRQQKKIDELEALCTALARRMAESQSRGTDASVANEKPPHY